MSSLVGWRDGKVVSALTALPEDLDSRLSPRVSDARPLMAFEGIACTWCKYMEAEYMDPDT